MLLWSHPAENSKACFRRPPVVGRTFPEVFTSLVSLASHGFRSRSTAYSSTSPWQGLWDYPWTHLADSEVGSRLVFPKAHELCQGRVDTWECWSSLGGGNREWILEGDQECPLIWNLCRTFTSCLICYLLLLPFFFHWVIIELLLSVSTLLHFILHNKSKLSFISFFLGNYGGCLLPAK